MNILGINYIFHDSSACLLVDGEIAHAVEEERLSRQKHTQSFPVLAVTESLEQSDIAWDQIDHIAISICPGKSEAKKLSYASNLSGSNASFLSYEFDRLKDRHLAFWAWYYSIWPANAKNGPKVHFVDHHLAHAAGSYFVSPLQSAALLSIDGWGEWSTSWMGSANGCDIKAIRESYFPNSLGVFYSVATQFCGFKPNYDEGKTMGLAPCGDANRYYDVVRGMVSVGEDLDISINQDWFDFPSLQARLFSRKFTDHFGHPRGADGAIEQNYCDVAASFQLVLEECVVELARGLKEITGEENLVYSGGVALNSVANGKILESGVFKDVFLMPGAGDNGTSIGAAAYVHNVNLKQEKRVIHHSPYLGKRYSDDEIESMLTASKVQFRKSRDVIEEAAAALAKGHIIGWFQGRMEFGPRALGARSILADPTNTTMKRKINAEVKHREPFRPFAPSVLREESHKYFDIDVEVPYMLKVATVRPNMRKKIPAVVHVDGTARLQTVDRSTAPEYYRLIKLLGERTGHPVVLNTSFNVMGEPIVESPLDAIKCFYSTGLDAMAIGSYFVEKIPTVEAVVRNRGGSNMEILDITA